MRWSSALLSLPLAAAYVPESTLGSDLLYAQSLGELIKDVATGDFQRHLQSKGVNRMCGLQNLAVRREYSTLSNNEKLDYTKAVKCLMSSPSKIPPGVAPGAKSRYDDFVATHINLTTTIHFTGNFFSWHRAFVWSFEEALRNECGYKGYLPYWNWGKSYKDPLNSPYFDGSPTSQGGNGVWAPHPCTPLFGGYCIPVVQGRGGGCVTGPYANFKANLSTVQNPFTADGVPAPGPIFSYQPRCMRRDISPELTRAFLGDSRLVRLMTDPIFADLAAFQPYFEGGSPVYPAGAPNGEYDVGLHGGPHYTWGGDPGGDVFSSPGDPMFFLLHAMVDRVWWIWQNQKPVERAFKISGTRTMFNDPPSANATIEDPIDMGWVQPKCSDSYKCSTLAHKHHVSSLAGPYCYIYG